MNGKQGGEEVTVSYFVIYEDGGDLERSAPFVQYYLERHVELVKRLPGVKSLLVMTRRAYDDPFLKDESGPLLVTHVVFDDLAALERAALSDERLAARADVANFPPFEGTVSYQAMRDEYYAPNPAPLARPRAPACYFVLYHRPAEDEAAFVDFYRRSHPPLLADLPGIREVGVFTPLDWRDRPFVARSDLMLANLIAFDSEAAFQTALASPARRKVRRDVEQFPRYTGKCAHTAMTRRCIVP
jgi:uncharacterized protein (TIGR02118 family)